MTQGVITGDLGTIGGKLPWAEESIKVAFGVENRHDKLQNTPDDLQAQALLSGSGGATIGIEGSTNVNDIFMEASVPLVQGKTGAEQLSFDTAYRYSDYSSGIQTDTYKFGMDWAPVEDIRFRASFQRAVRAPNIVELFTAQGFNLFDMDGDPCGAELSGTAEAAPATAGVPGHGRARRASCAARCSTARRVSTTSLQGGNTELDPETSDTYLVRHRVHAALRARPERVGRLLRHRSRRPDLDVRRRQHAGCVLPVQRRRPPARRIHRNPPNGALWVGNGNVDDLNTNIGGLQTSGVDLNLNYTGCEMGSWAASAST